ncbi:MAG: CPBP family intramembrane metalloprotease [Acidobacteriota bacterium]|nr:CPBP family intramembrane metalloprotease [Acidobacteriota bacterium]
MNITDFFIDPQTKLVRSVWRALAFLFVLMLPQWLISLLFKSSQMEPSAVFEVSIAMIFTYAVLIAWVVFISWLCLRLLDQRSLRSLGFALHQNWRREMLLGFAISVGMIAVVAGLQVIGGGTRIALNSVWWKGGGVDAAGLLLTTKEVLLALVLLILAAAVEELAFRGYAFQTLLRGAPPIVPMLLLSIYFGYGHWENPSRTSFSTANTVLAGVWLSLAYLKTRSLWLPTALHFGWNWTMGAVFGLPVSGLLIPQHSILFSTSGGPLWLTGGSYGPEGGAAATIVVIASSIFIWRAKWLSVAPEVQAALIETAQPEDSNIRLNLQNE